MGDHRGGRRRVHRGADAAEILIERGQLLELDGAAGGQPKGGEEKRGRAAATLEMGGVHRDSFRRGGISLYCLTDLPASRRCANAHGANPAAPCAFTRICPSTPNIRGRRAATSISSISPIGPPARASAWSEPAISRTRHG